MDAQPVQAEPRPVAPVPQAQRFDFQQWIQILCSQTGVRINDIPKEVMEVLRVNENKNEVNKMFFQWQTEFNKPKPLVLNDKQKEFFKKIVTIENHPEYISAKQNIESGSRQIRDYSRAIDQQLESMARSRMQMDRISGNGSVDLWPEVEKILADGWYRLQINEDPMNAGASTSINFLTPRVELTHVNAAAGIREVCDMGTYLVKWFPLANQIQVHPHEGNITLGDTTIHPHMRAQNVCWGNAVDTMTRAMANRQPLEAFKALRVIFQTYNPSSPYRALNDFIAVRARNKYHGHPTEFVLHTASAWINASDMPGSWATTYVLDEVEGEDDDDGDYYHRYRLQVFIKRYMDTTVQPEEEVGRYYIRTRNGQNYQINDSDVYEWED